jgi:plastocyanin
MQNAQLKLVTVSLGFALLTAACGGSTPASDPAAAAAASAPGATAGQARRVDPATAGTVAGKVTLTGPAPAIETLHIAADQTCIAAMGKDTPSGAILIGADGAIQNAFVYIKDSLADYTFDVPTEPVVLDQVGCQYTPRIFGVRVGQPLVMKNSDATFHNVHAMPMVNQEFNRGLPKPQDEVTQIFTAPEQMIRFKCDLHAWMSAYGGVMSHPFFAVTGADGTFSLKGVPPGEY